MQYREIEAADFTQAMRTLSLAFGDGGEDSMAMRWLESAERPSELRGMYAGGQLTAQLEIQSFEVQSGRGTLPAAGFGAVASPPEHRRRGYVAALLREACEELHGRGVLLLFLDPFKESFYGRYGWSVFSERRRYRGAPDRFAPFRRIATPHGQFVPCGIDEAETFDAVYREALRGRFGPVARTPQWWRQSVLGSAYSGRANQAFVWRDDQGRARAYTIYRLEQGDKERTVRCREMVALDPEARAQLFAFLAGHDVHVERIQFDAPPDAPVNALFPDTLECSIEPNFMVRILDVAALLSAYPFAKGAAGRVTLAVSDEWLPRNQGVFALEVDAQGSGQCRPIGAHDGAQLRCDIRVLNRLVSRLVRPRTAATFGLLDVADRAALGLLEEWFAGLQPFFSEQF